MKLNKIVAILGLLAATSAQVAMAQPSVVVENAAVPDGTMTVDIDVTFTPDAGNTATAVFEVAFNDSALTLTNVAGCAPPPQFACSTPSPGVIRWAATPDFGGNLPGFTGVVTFDVTGATVGVVYPLVVQNEDYLDPGAMPLPPMGTMNGSIQVQDVPAPVFNLTHDGGGAGSTIDFGVDNLPGAANIILNGSVNNIGNDPMNNLAGDCVLTDSVGGIFAINPDPITYDLAPMGSEPIQLACGTDTPGVYMGTLTCTHNAASSPDVFTLLCEEAPTPTYSDAMATLPLVMNGTEGNADPGTTLLLDNTGEPMSVLTGTCGLSGDAEISIGASGAAFSVLQGSTDNIDLTCSAAAEGMYTSTLTCTADPSASNAGAFMYPVTCDIGPPDPGTWGSTPLSGGNVDLTPGGPVVEGTDLTNAGQLLVFNDGDPGDANLTYSCDISGGATQITQNPAPSAGTLVAGDPATVINYSCDTTADGSYVANVECTWSNPIEGIGGTEMYTASCDVRDAFVDVVESPPSGTPQTAELMPGESFSWSFDFDEIIGELNGDGSVTCSLMAGTDFNITSAAGGVVPSGGNFQVDVEFTDPGVGDTFNDVLLCTITDNPDGGEPELEDVSWPFEVTVIGRNATFNVTKDFNDDNPMGVEMALDCNTGLPLFQTGTVHDADVPGLRPGQFTELEFIVVDFEPGELNCEVYETTVPAGYEVAYDGDFGENGVAASAGETDEACVFTGIESADFTCAVTNTLQASTLTVNKEWIDDNPGFNLPLWAEITVVCENVQDIEEGFGCLFDGGGNTVCINDYIDPANPGVYNILPHWDGTTVCSVTETPEAGVDQDVSDCASISLAPGVDGECTIVNTRLYEGIPTLSQYGLLLMALMMLGVGLVGFRRYS